jgi:hypothetical protein
MVKCGAEPRVGRACQASDLLFERLAQRGEDGVEDAGTA